MNKFKKGVLVFMTVLLYFSIIFSPIAMLIDCLLEIEQRLEENNNKE